MTEPVLNLLGGQPASAQLVADCTALTQLQEATSKALMKAVALFVSSEDADALKAAMATLAAQDASAPVAAIRASARGLVSLSTLLLERGSAIPRDALAVDLKRLFGGADALQSLAARWLAHIHPSLILETVAPRMEPMVTEAAAQSSRSVTPARSTSETVDASSLSYVLSANQLIDMTWRFGLTAGNSAVKHVGDSFLQLALQLDQGGPHPRTVHVELSLPQFYAFLAELERAAKAIELFS